MRLKTQKIEMKNQQIVTFVFWVREYYTPSKCKPFSMYTSRMKRLPDLVTDVVIDGCDKTRLSRMD